MKRKDWRIKSLKKDIFDKKIKKIKRIRERFLFLRKLYLRQNRYLIKKNLFVNFIFYKNFLSLYKSKKQNYFFNLFWKTKLNNFFFFPGYSTTKNVFNKKIKFKDLSKKIKLNLIFLPNKYEKNNFGLNYYIIEKKDKILILLKELEHEDFENLIYLKKEKNDFYIENNLNIFNYYFNYNLYNLYLLEIYKILILIHLNKN